MNELEALQIIAASLQGIMIFTCFIAVALWARIMIGDK